MTQQPKDAHRSDSPNHQSKTTGPKPKGVRTQPKGSATVAKNHVVSDVSKERVSKDLDHKAQNPPSEKTQKENPNAARAAEGSRKALDADKAMRGTAENEATQQDVTKRDSKQVQKDIAQGQEENRDPKTNPLPTDVKPISLDATLDVTKEPRDVQEFLDGTINSDIANNVLDPDPHYAAIVQQALGGLDGEGASVKVRETVKQLLQHVFKIGLDKGRKEGAEGAASKVMLREAKGALGLRK